MRYPRPVTDKPVSRKVALRPAEGLRRKVDYGSELNPEQLAVVMHAGGPMLVLAGAGSGKTRTVVYRVARLLEDGVDPNAILLLTFTNRAAREMLSRVGLLLGPGRRARDGRDVPLGRATGCSAGSATGSATPPTTASSTARTPAT